MCEVSGEDMGRESQSVVIDLAASLRFVSASLDSLDGDYASYKHRLDQLHERLVEGHFRLAVLGQFKRGKSTLLNALLGEDLLPTDILPVTAIPTFISFSPQVSARVLFSSEREPQHFSLSEYESLADFLVDFVTESGNPNNQRRVDRVEIGHPSKLLQQGVILIDTPGIGSTHKHNTEVAYQILPQCDAALFLVSPDPPITEIELDYLKEICQRLPRTFYLLNKIDFLSETEQIASMKFLSDQLSPLLKGKPQILPVSARKGLEAREANDPEGWKKSGMQQVDQNLIDFFAREKQQTLENSIRRRLCDQLENISLQLQLSLSALKMSEEELDQRIEEFRRSLPDVEREKLASEDMLSGDLKRIEIQLGKEVESVRLKAKENILSRLETHFQTIADTEVLERTVRDELSENIPQFFSPEMRRMNELIYKEATRLLTLHQDRSNALIEKVRRNAADLFSIPYRAPSAQGTYVTLTAPTWDRALFISDMDPLGQKLSRKFLTHKFRHRRTISRLREEGRKLINQNVEQINWTLRRGLDESFRQFGTDLAEQLDCTITATKSAMEVALKKSEEQGYETAIQELKLKQVLEQIQKVLGQLD